MTRTKPPAVNSPLQPGTRIGFEPGQVSPPTMTPDWEEYFRNFCAAHGHWYVEDGGRLIFADGWCYSADDHAGPEWPPPTNLFDLANLLRKYWRRRRQLVTAERDKLQAEIENLHGATRAKSGEIPVKRYTLSELGNWIDRGEFGSIDWTSLASRLRWLNADVLLCDRELRELGD